MMAMIGLSGMGTNSNFTWNIVLKTPELRFKLFDKTLKHLLMLYGKNIVIKNLSISNIYVLSEPLDILVAQLRDYTEAKEDFKTFNKTMEVVLQMASQLFPGVVKEINEDKNSSDKSKRVSRRSFVINLSDDEKRQYFDSKEVIEGEDNIFEFLKKKLLSGKNNGNKWHKVELFKIDTSFFLNPFSNIVDRLAITEYKLKEIRNKNEIWGPVIERTGCFI